MGVVGGALPACMCPTPTCWLARPTVGCGWVPAAAPSLRLRPPIALLPSSPCPADLEESDTSSSSSLGSESGSDWGGWEGGGSAGLMLGEVVEECPFLEDHRPHARGWGGRRAAGRRDSTSSDVRLAGWLAGWLVLAGWEGGKARAGGGGDRQRPVWSSCRTCLDSPQPGRRTAPNQTT